MVLIRIWQNKMNFKVKSIMSRVSYVALRYLSPNEMKLKAIKVQQCLQDCNVCSSFLVLKAQPSLSYLLLIICIRCV